jgi:hypothetical protein
VEVLRRARLDGYEGGKSALYSLAASLRPRHVRLVMHASRGCLASSVSTTSAR